MKWIDTGPYPPGYGMSLFTVAHSAAPKRCLEIGTETGLSAANLLLASPKARLTSIDVEPCDAARERLTELQLVNRWKFIQGDSHEVVPGLRGKFDWIYVDGDHSYEGTLADLRNCWEKLASGGMLVADDYAVGIVPGVRQAVDEFAAERDVEFKALSGNPHGAIVFAPKP